MQVFVVQSSDGLKGHGVAEAVFPSREEAEAHIRGLIRSNHRAFVITELEMMGAEVSFDLRAIIREEVRAAFEALPAESRLFRG